MNTQLNFPGLQHYKAEQRVGCSFGNAGMIVPSHIVPLVQPGMVAKGMRMLMRSPSPFYIKPRLSADLLRWGWLFIATRPTNTSNAPFRPCGTLAC